ncbi:MAG: LysE family translocator [Prevotellaceae bacterium]|nr:LysE family translocator [Candidatus Colivivens equi]MCQ2076079.1 LysE family translocator [Bacteroidaceae bacterium]
MKNIGTFEMILKGLVIGIFASAPMGPVGILCVRRTLNKGRWIGFATGVGASISDIIYALITGLGLSFVVDIIEDPSIAYWMKIIGSVIFLLFGIYTFRSNPVGNFKPVPKAGKGTLAQNMLTGFLVTFSNPMIISFFGVLFSMFTFILKDNVLPQVLGYISIVIGALLWWFGLTWLIDKARKSYNIRIVWIINRGIGIAVMVVSALMLTYTLTGHSFPMLND